jgi:hypothetical protein
MTGQSQHGELGRVGVSETGRRRRCDGARAITSSPAFAPTLVEGGLVSLSVALVILYPGPWEQPSCSGRSSLTCEGDEDLDEPECHPAVATTSESSSCWLRARTKYLPTTALRPGAHCLHLSDHHQMEGTPRKGRGPRQGTWTGASARDQGCRGSVEAVERVPRKDGAGVLHSEGGGPAQCASSQFFSFSVRASMLSDGWMVRADCLATPLDPLHWLSD